MPRIHLFYVIVPLLMVVGMFLPVVSYDLYSGGVFSSNRQLTEEHVLENGLDKFFCYVPLLIALLTTIISNINRSTGTAIAGLILMLLTTLYLPLEAFGLTFTLFGPRRNTDVEIGYWINVLCTISFVVFMIYEIINRRRQSNRMSKEITHSSKDLLDDF